MTQQAPDWQQRRAEHKALLRASRGGLDNLVEFTGQRNAKGYLLFRVWSQTQPKRYIVQSTDAGDPKHCTCKYDGICAHMGAVWIYQHPRVTEVRPLPTPQPQRQKTPKDRDYRSDPVTHVA